MKEFILSPVSNPDAFSFPYGMLNCCYETLFELQSKSSEGYVEYKNKSLMNKETKRKRIPDKTIDF